MVEIKKYEEMTALELKGVLFDLNNQIRFIQQEAQTKIVPLLEAKIKEEQNKEIKE